MRYEQLILGIVANSEKHLTAEELFFALKKMYPGVAMATVYNNLNKLCRQGLVSKVSMEGQPDRYDRTVRHDHLVCNQCGEISDLFLDDLGKELEKQCGFPIDGYDLKIRYVCPECRKKLPGGTVPEGAEE